MPPILDIPNSAAAVSLFRLPAHTAGGRRRAGEWSCSEYSMPCPRSLSSAADPLACLFPLPTFSMGSRCCRPGGGRPPQLEKGAAKGAEGCGELYTEGGDQLLPGGRPAQSETGLFQLFQQLRLLKDRDAQGIERMVSHYLLPWILRRSGAAEIGRRGVMRSGHGGPPFLTMGDREDHMLDRYTKQTKKPAFRTKAGRQSCPLTADSSRQDTFCGRYPSIYQSSRFPGLRITARRAFSPCSGCTAMALAVRSPFTVTGSLGIFTRFPFHLTFIRHLKGYLVVLLTSFYDICPAFVNREGKYQIDRLSADGYGKIYCNWRRDVLYCMAQVLDRHCCPLKRETGVNPVRTRHCDRGIQGQDATERSGRRPCVRIRKPGDLPVLLAKEILRATSNWS